MIKKIIFFLFGSLVAFLLVFGVAVNGGKDKWSQLNLAIGFSQKHLLLAVNPLQKTIFLIVFPPDLTVEAFAGYGQFKLNKLDELARQEKDNRLTLKTLEKNFGLPLDFCFLSFGAGLGLDSKEDIFSRLSGFLVKEAFSSKSFSLKERLNLIRASRSLVDRSFNTKLIDAEKEGFLLKGKETVVLDQSKWDNWASVFLADSAIQDEGLPVGIYNTTGRSGLGEGLARILVDAGMIIVSVKDDDRPVENCLLGIKKEEYRKSKTFLRIQKLLSCETEILPASSFQDSTELNLYLGEAFQY